MEALDVRVFGKPFKRKCEVKRDLKLKPSA